MLIGTKNHSFISLKSTQGSNGDLSICCVICPREQKILNRKTKGSASRGKARLLVAKCHERLANTQNDFQHKLSKTMVDGNQAIIVETLKVKNMLKNRKLSRHIADVAWSSLLIKLEYKAKDSGKQFKKIDQWYASSKTCCACHKKVEEMSLSTRHWI
jgi:putative transposase